MGDGDAFDGHATAFSKSARIDENRQALPTCPPPEQLGVILRVEHMKCGKNSATSLGKR